MMANRIGRLELLFWFVASSIGGGILLDIVGAFTHTKIEPMQTSHPWPQALVVIAIALVWLRAYVARLHDIGWPALAMIVLFVPLVNLIAMLILFVAPGQKQPNRYGNPPMFLERLRKLPKDPLKQGPLPFS
jgi:uncharacterized membrane protein YhaH (DUF805 family)